MAGPPNSVTVSSPIPTGYFGQSFGAVSTFPSVFQANTHTSPIIPVPHPDVRTVIPTVPVIHTPAPTRLIQGWVNRIDFTNPLAYWQREVSARRFGRRWL